MENAFTETLKAAKERVSNPIVGSFVIAWAAINWRATLVILFGVDSVTGSGYARYLHLESYYEEMGGWYVWGLPIATTVAYLIGVTWVKRLYKYYVLTTLERPTEKNQASKEIEINEFKEYRHNAPWLVSEAITLFRDINRHAQSARDHCKKDNWDRTTLIENILPNLNEITTRGEGYVKNYATAFHRDDPSRLKRMKQKSQDFQRKAAKFIKMGWR